MAVPLKITVPLGRMELLCFTSAEQITYWSGASSTSILPQSVSMLPSPTDSRAYQCAVLTDAGSSFALISLWLPSKLPATCAPRTSSTCKIPRSSSRGKVSPSISTSQSAPAAIVASLFRHPAPKPGNGGRPGSGSGVSSKRQSGTHALADSSARVSVTGQTSAQVPIAASKSAKDGEETIHSARVLSSAFSHSPGIPDVSAAAKAGTVAGNRTADSQAASCLPSSIPSTMVHVVLLLCQCRHGGRPQTIRAAAR